MYFRNKLSTISLLILFSAIISSTAVAQEVTPNVTIDYPNLSEAEKLAIIRQAEMDYFNGTTSSIVIPGARWYNWSEIHSNPEIPESPSIVYGNATSGGFSIYGKLVEENCTPIARISIDLYELSLENGTNLIMGPLVCRATTDDDGNFAFINITINSEYCRLGESRPGNFWPGGTDTKSEGVQNVTLVRIRELNDAPPRPTPESLRPLTPLNQELILIALTIAIIAFILNNERKSK